MCGLLFTNGRIMKLLSFLFLTLFLTACQSIAPQTTEIKELSDIPEDLVTIDEILVDDEEGLIHLVEEEVVSEPEQLLPVGIIIYAVLII